jgi:hypothetical protein
MKGPAACGCSEKGQLYAFWCGLNFLSANTHQSSPVINDDLIRSLTSSVEVPGERAFSGARQPSNRPIALARNCHKRLLLQRPFSEHFGCCRQKLEKL